MELSIVLVISLVILEVQCRGWYQQSRQYSNPLRTSYNNYDDRPYQNTKLYSTESFGHHSHHLPTQINSFDLNEHPINGKYICTLCYTCYRDTSSEERSYEETWSQPNVVVLYRHNNRIYKVGKENGCPYTYDLCCCKVYSPPATSFQLKPYRPSWSPQIPNTNLLTQPRPQSPTLISPQPYPPRPSYIPPQTPAWKPSTQPQTPRPSYIPPQTPAWKPSPQPQTPRPSMMYPYTPIWKPSPQPPSSSYLPPQDPAKNPSPQPQPPRPSQIFPPPNANCTCTPFFRCYDEETSSNLTGTVDDRNHFSAGRGICFNSNDVCCYNLIKPLLVPTRNSSRQPQPPNPSQIFPSPNANCTCTPFFACYDEDTSSNLTGTVDDRNNNQENCPDPNDVCCFNLVTPFESQPINPSLLPEPQGPPTCTCTPFFRCYDEETSSNLTDVVNDRNQENCQSHNDICCYNLVQPPQDPPQNFSSPIDDCTCTPFFRCYDEETSSNLTDVVNDRNQNCMNPSDICCYNLVQPPQGPPQNFSSPTDDCKCTPFFRCYDEETSSNLTDVVNDRNQENCQNPSDICCYNLVQPPQGPPQNFSSPIDDCTCTSFFRCYDEETSSNLTDIVNDRIQNCQNPNDICCYNLVQPPQGPPQTFSSPIDDCTCTPFFRCYDEETSSNLTGTVDDRNNILVRQDKCPNSNDVCCYNLVDTSPIDVSGILARSMSLQDISQSPSSQEGEPLLPAVYGDVQFPGP